MHFLQCKNVRVLSQSLSNAGKSSQAESTQADCTETESQYIVKRQTPSLGRQPVPQCLNILAVKSCRIKPYNHHHHRLQHLLSKVPVSNQHYPKAIYELCKLLPLQHLNLDCIDHALNGVFTPVNNMNKKL